MDNSDTDCESRNHRKILILSPKQIFVSLVKWIEQAPPKEEPRLSLLEKTFEFESS